MRPTPTSPVSSIPCIPRPMAVYLLSSLLLVELVHLLGSPLTVFLLFGLLALSEVLNLEDFMVLDHFQLLANGWWHFLENSLEALDVRDAEPQQLGVAVAVFHEWLSVAAVLAEALEPLLDADLIWLGVEGRAEVAVDGFRHG